MTYEDKLREISRLQDAIGVAQAMANDAIEEHLPIGAPILWDRGGQTQHGEVRGHANRGRILVLNYRTEKEYWTDIFCVIREAWARL